MEYKTHEFREIHQLRDQFLNDDDTAFAKIYQILAPKLYSLGLSLKIKKTLIEDAIHDTFEEIYKYKQNLRKVKNVKLYFMAAFRNNLFALVKKERNISDVDVADIHLPEGLIEKDHLEQWIEAETFYGQQNLIKKLIDQLTPNQREAIFYRFVEGCTLDEISSLMNINYQSVKNLIYRSILKLKDQKTTF